ncbi:hypothetical protein [Aeromicrobium sp. 179-A 4D2 NHS]|uniref:hypothetical protein n=1 Tax=Aeromicrobium sp. 179-A 4D2 NHS TaxID=3142375 RepID=UPI00399F3F43
MRRQTKPTMQVFAYGPDLPRTIYAAIMGVHRQAYDLMLAEVATEWVEGGSSTSAIETTQQYAVNCAAVSDTHVIYKGAEAYVARPTDSPRAVPGAGLVEVGDLYNVETPDHRGTILIANDITRTEMLATAVELMAALSPRLTRFDLPNLSFMDSMFVNWMSGSDDAITIGQKGVAWTQ